MADVAPSNDQLGHEIQPNGHQNGTSQTSTPVPEFPKFQSSGFQAQNAPRNDASSRDQPHEDSPAPYGTRKKQRVNYADELMDFEKPIQRGGEARKRSASVEPPVSFRDEAEAPRATSGLKINLSKSNASSQNSTPSSKAEKPSSTSTSTMTDAKSEAKKRKLDRINVSKGTSSPDVRSPTGKPGDPIPGTSSFFANGTAEVAPPKKRRKTDDDVGVSGSATRKNSASKSGLRDSHGACAVTFERSGAVLRNGKLEADDGSGYAVNDTVYLVCEPPGDPYYICRIMAFQHKEQDNSSSPVVSMLINWFYRPRDIGKLINDPRHLFASMQSDECPLSSLRGKCIIKHKGEVLNFEEYRKRRDTFHFSQLYDRYSHRPYEVVPCSAVVNVPENVKKALDDNWKYLVVEIQRQKELTSAVKLCKRCGRYCAPNDSVDCGVCRETYHMACVSPPLTKRPSRGFAWSCGPCSRAQERKLEQRQKTVLAAEASKESLDDVMEEEEEEAGDEAGAVTAEPEIPDRPGPVEPPPEKAEVSKANMWPWRYLGTHCKVEDVLQYDDRAIYPRATSRIGTRYQTYVPDWPGQPVEFVKPSDIARKAAKAGSNKKDPKVSKDTMAAIQQEKAERAKRPKWVQDEPAGYVARGEDFDESDPRCTATPLFAKPPEQKPASGFVAANTRGPANDKMIDEYMKEVGSLAQQWGLAAVSKKGYYEVSTNLLDYALKLLTKNKFNFAASLDMLRADHSRKTIKEPDFTKEEIKKFEDGVAKYGSELRSVRKYYVKGKPHGQIVRFYYTWKFSPRGNEIWGNHQGRRGVKKRAETSWVDIADDEDDSAFDNDKVAAKKRKFCCKFCSTRASRQWRRAPGVSAGDYVLADPKGGKEKSNQLILALCQRCAHLWRRYAMEWQEPDEYAKAVIASGGRQWKRKHDEDHLREFVLANEAAGVPTNALAAQAAAFLGITITVAPPDPKKKAREKESTPSSSTSDPSRKKSVPPQPVVAPRLPTPPLEPEPPKWRELECAVCRYLDSPTDDLMLTCRDCKLTVHRRCYAIDEQANGPVNAAKWVCDTCMNDRQTQHSLRYECALCPVSDRDIDLLEPPKVTHKKKTDRDREKERLEKEMATKMIEEYRRDQRKHGRPVHPREALKVTASNNWMHITCATWTPEIKFSNATQMQLAEGMGAVAASPTRMDALCKLCKIPKGSCVQCLQCKAPFHVACAHQAGYVMGFDLTPVKTSRKEANQSVTLGAETGVMHAAIWCKEHSIKTIVHDMSESVDETGFNTLQLFCAVMKQADLTLTGTARKANLLGGVAKQPTQTVVDGHKRRTSLLTNGANGKDIKQDQAEDCSIDGLVDGTMDLDTKDKRCKTCGTDFALKWHRLPESDHQPNGLTNGASVPTWQCHKCRMRDEQGIQSESPEKDGGLVSQPLSDPPDIFRFDQVAPRSFLGPDCLDRFAQDLKTVTITLTNPTFGGLHIFRGRDFGLDLDSDPTPLFRYISYYAQQKCGYDQERDVIITEDGSWITWPKSMMQALVKMIMSGSREAHWRVMPARDIPCKIMDTTYLNHTLKLRDYPMPPAPSQALPPPTLMPQAQAHYSGQLLSGTPQAAPPPYVGAAYAQRPPVRTGYPPHPGMTSPVGPASTTTIYPPPPHITNAPPPARPVSGNSAFGYPSGPASAASPYYGTGPRLSSVTSPIPQAVEREREASAITNANASAQNGGASSSPNLKNLMH